MTLPLSPKLHHLSPSPPIVVLNHHETYVLNPCSFFSKILSARIRHILVSSRGAVRVDERSQDCSPQPSSFSERFLEFGLPRVADGHQLQPHASRYDFRFRNRRYVEFDRSLVSVIKCTVCQPLLQSIICNC